ncbi:MAG TPA: transcriptional repressor [Gammaproteobacteria bacterium]|nr:transcriptional repressor [Gammaproteobacteria bacterium]
MSVHQCPHAGKTSCMRPTSLQVESLINQAEQLCEQRQQRFTALRRRVLTLICQAESPMGAYQLLEFLQGDGRSAAPPTIYRALDFLMAQGLIHRLASNNTYLACAHPQQDHEAVFLVCQHCGQTQEIHTDGITHSVQEKASRYKFKVLHTSVEVAGLCAKCSPGFNPPSAGGLA